MSDSMDFDEDDGVLGARLLATGNGEYITVFGTYDQLFPRPARSNEELVHKLEESGVIESTDGDIRDAMLACDRKVFVPSEHKTEAYIDQPIHVVKDNFNISAPHMHAMCLKLLDVEKGMSILDVGSGSGLMTAYLSMLTGPSGTVVGLDILAECIAYGKEGVSALREPAESEFLNNSGMCSFERADAFIACETSPHRGEYDRVLVGGACPPDRVKALLKFLKGPGSKMLIPITPSNLTMFTKRSEGYDEEVCQQVRFTDLSVPSEMYVLRQILHQEKVAKLLPPEIKSSYKSDFEEIKSHLKEQIPDRARLIAAARSFEELEFVLGEPDCVLNGDGWKKNVHSIVLKSRCEYFRARSASGMKDSALNSIQMPDVPEDAASVFTKYLYDDTVEISPDLALDVLVLAYFYDIPQLITGCEIVLAKLVHDAAGRRKESTPEGTSDDVHLVLDLFKKSHTYDLAYLGAVTADFIISNMETVLECDGFSMLDKEHVLSLLFEASMELSNVHKKMAEMSTKQDPGPDSVDNM